MGTLPKLSVSQIFMKSQLLIIGHIFFFKSKCRRIENSTYIVCFHLSSYSVSTQLFSSVIIDGNLLDMLTFQQPVFFQVSKEQKDWSQASHCSPT